MHLSEMAFALEKMFEGIVGGRDFLIQESLNPLTGEAKGDAKLVKWELPIVQPSIESIKSTFEKYKDEFEKPVLIDDNIRKQEIVDKFLNKQE